MVVEHQAIQLHSVTNEYVPQYPLLSLQEVQATFQRKRTEWESSGACQELISTLRSAAIPNVKNIVAFACFNMSDCAMAERSACQHALILILRQFFAKQQHITEGDIPCFAQDPLYEDVDKKVLADAGISALENPRAFLVVDDTSLVISISPEAPIRQIIADIAQPAVMIWNRVEEAQRGAELIGQTEWCGPLFKCSNVSDVLTYFCLLSEDNISPRVEDMVRQHYAELSFPVDQEHFGSRISLYIRNTRSHQ